MREAEEEILRSFSFTTNAETNSEASSTNAFLQLESPQANEVVTSPFTVRGVVDSEWYFNEDLYISLETNTGEILAEVPVSLGTLSQEEKKTFEVSLAFDA
jgi:hypothetical protein